jgi:hypothetical protein
MEDTTIPADISEEKKRKTSESALCTFYDGNVGTVCLLPDGRNFIALFD